MAGIDGKTQLLGVMGWPVSHTKSPLMQNAALRAAGINAAYLPLAVAPERLGDALRGLRALGFLGCNLTIPHKLDAMAFLDRLTEPAALIGATNTVRVENDGTLTGHNTDWQGVTLALERDGTRLDGRTVAVVGAGGAGRATAVGCALAGAARVMLLNRTLDRATALAEELGQRLPGAPTRWHAATLDEGCAWEEVDVVLQMTSLGMNGEGTVPVPVERLPAHCHVLDAVYAPLETAFLKAARDRGLKTTDGLEMLLQQGAAAFEFWLGRKPDVDVMRAALKSV